MMDGCQYQAEAKAAAEERLRKAEEEELRLAAEVAKAREKTQATLSEADQAAKQK